VESFSRLALARSIYVDQNRLCHCVARWGWLTVRPNVQYIVHPGGTDHVDNALVAGIKLQTKF